MNYNFVFDSRVSSASTTGENEVIVIGETHTEEWDSCAVGKVCHWFADE